MAILHYMTKGKILLLAGKVLLVIAAYYSKEVIFSVLIETNFDFLSLLMALFVLFTKKLPYFQG